MAENPPVGDDYDFHPEAAITIDAMLTGQRYKVVIVRISRGGWH